MHTSLRARNGKFRSMARSTQIHSALNCLRKLIVLAMESSLVGPIHGDIRGDSFAFDAISVPTHICADWNDESVIVSDLEG